MWGTISTTRRHLCHICGVNTDMPLPTPRRRTRMTAVAAVFGATCLVAPGAANAAAPATPAAVGPASTAFAMPLSTPGLAPRLTPTPSQATLDKQIDAASNQLEIVIERFDAMQDSLLE